MELCPGFWVRPWKVMRQGRYSSQRRQVLSRKYWIAYGLPTEGSLILDNGARDALLLRGKSLLPSGITGVKGDFEARDAVTCEDVSGKAFAKGLVNYNSVDIEKIKGKRTTEIEGILGIKDFDEVIHRDNM